ncbi:hypothetical protein QR680_017919 [Steinernema hermaphroditum]|uniref:Uncharacterized protein n=1 Tax=Steinernema hermaphroditum TaxID=289476 RepID=A0AA39HID1_9BILA|nr:hypothetical protein QR680_017919 [Steinernema hermaphroditum]
MVVLDVIVFEFAAVTASVGLASMETVDEEVGEEETVTVCRVVESVVVGSTPLAVVVIFVAPVGTVDVFGTTVEAEAKTVGVGLAAVDHGSVEEKSSEDAVLVEVGDILVTGEVLAGFVIVEDGSSVATDVGGLAASEVFT